jgi:hypothetical protein
MSHIVFIELKENLYEVKPKENFPIELDGAVSRSTSK